MSEYLAFINALQAGRQIRQRMFDTIEQRHAGDFGNGEDGKRLYEDLLSAVRDCGEAQAVEEFERRFFPLLAPNQPRSAAEIGGPQELTKEDRTTEGRRRLAWASAACVAALTMGVLLFGFNALKMRTAVHLNIAKSSIPAAHATVPPSEPDTMNDPAAAPTATAPFAAEEATGLAAPETITDPAVPATEQDDKMRVFRGAREGN